jgi:peptidoglycan/LPS O-acetylase OafA/YrhL
VRFGSVIGAPMLAVSCQMTVYTKLITPSGIAALAVIISHYLGVFWFSRNVAGIIANAVVPSEALVKTPALANWIITGLAPVNIGAFGVGLFFLISGFVIPFSLLRTNAKDFLVGRFFRIYPLYAAGFTVTLTALYLSSHIGGRPFPYTHTNVLIHYVPGLRDIMHFPTIDYIIWTLEIELKFYVLCAVCSKLLRTASLWTFAVPALLFCAVHAWHGEPLSSLVWVLSHDCEYMIFMFVGVAFNFYFRKRYGLATFAGIVFTLLLAFWNATSISGEGSYLLVSYGTALVIFAVSAAMSPWWPRFWILSKLADISFPLYVVHGVMGYAMLAFMISRGVPPLAAILFAMLMAFFIAYLLHVLVENPSKEIGKLLVNKAFSTPTAIQNATEC